MSHKNDLEKQSSHPGWAVLFEDKTWLENAHGWGLTENAFYAYIFDSEESAIKTLNYLHGMYPQNSFFKMEAHVVEAWEPACENLRFEISNLRKTNIISHMDVSDVAEELKITLSKVQGWLDKTGGKP